jgi:hypothetical protein
MADFVVSISNSINCFGPAPSTKWGTGTNTMTWGSSKWGEGSADLISESEKILSVQSIVIMGGVASLSPNKLISDTFELLSETTSQDLRTANGYYYFFVKPTLDPEQRNQSTYTVASVSATTYTTAPVTSITWSSA